MKKENTLKNSSPLKYDGQASGSSGSLSGTNLTTNTSTNAGLGGSIAIINNATSTVNITTNDWVQTVRGSDDIQRDDDYIEVEFVNTCRPTYVLEKHMSVIRKGPTSPPKIEMYQWEDEADIDTTVTDPDGLINIKTVFSGDLMSNQAVDQTMISIFYDTNKELLKVGDEIQLPIDLVNDGGNVGSGKALDWNNGYTLLVTHNYLNQFNVRQKATARLVITDDPLVVGSVVCTVLAISDNFPVTAATAADLYEVTAEQIPPLFELKFPKFSYRYKYEDGEYSVYAPWSEVAFMPGKFDYLPSKGYNLGMVNNMRTLKVLDWRPKNMPQDVVEIDLLYKESNSPNVYTVETFKKDDPADYDNPCQENRFPNKVNHWNACGTGENFGRYTISSELIHKVVPSNQLLRPWDNVPRKALAQDITANRLIYANYLQSYNILDENGDVIKPQFARYIETEDLSMTGGELGATAFRNPGEPMKSLKSMRTYQVGVVYRDRYGRETPVLTSESGSVHLPIENAKTQNRLNVWITSPPPNWAESYTFYIKETSNEYYNLSMDRWYDAEDDGIWLSFPSSERNKISDRTTLILKKQHNTHSFVESKTKYKVLSVKNDAPTFIKTEYKFWGSIPMMLPPPGWGESGKPGGWDTGMFHITGLPLPNRLYIDVYAEYWDQSVLSGLEGKGPGAQVRVTQSIDQRSAYNSRASDSHNKSRWYDVAKVSYIGSEPQMYVKTTLDPAGNTIEEEVEVPGQAEQIVRISLEEIMGEDLAFCEGVGSTLTLSRGLSLEARTKVVRDRAQFEGRFFVKVLRDSDIQSNIVSTSQPSTDFYQVLMSRSVRYINAAHPGVQDANRGESGTPGHLKGAYWGFKAGDNSITSAVNFLPANINFNKVNTGGVNYLGLNLKKHPSIKYLVSSFSEACGDMPYEGPVGMVETNEDVSGAAARWPFGRSMLANKTFSTGWYYNNYQDFVDFGVASDFATHYNTNPPGGLNYAFDWQTNQSPPLEVVPHTAKQQHDWPSYLGSDWEPRICHKDSSGSPGTVSSSSCTCGDIKPGNAACLDRFITYRANSVLDVSDHTVNFSQLNRGFNDLRGANPFLIPAIWGDQSDLLGYSGTPEAATGHPVNSLNLTSSDPVNINTLPSGYRSVFDKDTIKKLRKDWYYLWHGRDKVSQDWPLGRFSPMRWFFDKCGAASGHSGNGIWTDQDLQVSKISLAFYGIGSVNQHFRSHNMMVHQQNEFEFAKLMMTNGTQFRFSSDPHQIVYTITDVGVAENVFNYEGSHGSWGYAKEGSTQVYGGGNLGEKHVPPWGSSKIGENSVASKPAFLSDLFSSTLEKNGSAPYNYRARITITLDKIIGESPESPPLGNTTGMGFHPLLNHVDIDGNCNIQEGPQVYWDGVAGSAPSSWIGGTALRNSPDVLPTPNAFYNLSSYWNYTGGSGSAPISGQSSEDGSGNTDGQHFGLHERGLNSTDIEIVVPYQGDETRKEMSSNPAVWETEPMEDVGLDIYYAASPTYPIDLRRYRSDEYRPDDTDYDANGVITNAHLYDYNWRGEEMIQIGARVSASGGANALADCNGTGSPCLYGHWANVVGVQGNQIWVDSHLVEDSNGDPVTMQPGDLLEFVWKGEGEWYGAHWDNYLYTTSVDSSLDINIFKIDPITHNKKRTLPYFNCYTFSNGVESNRIRDDYNAVTIDKGVKASMPLAETYEEERKPSSLIFSGIYNSTSGINRTNQFIQAEPITKDLNPINGSIQKLFARDTDLVTFCENKVFKILAKKDALFNADGNKNVTSNAAVLGQTLPFTGEYGISRNPESLASESYRLYFSDKDRGAILRLSRDGITPISDKGMKNWFKDNLRFATSIIGSFDQRKDEYNITIETADNNDSTNERAYTASYTEKSKGWVSFKSFVHQGGVSYKNVYYTFPSNVYSHLLDEDPWGVPYSTSGVGNAEVYQHSLDLRVTRIISQNAINTDEIRYSPDLSTIIIEGMNVEGNGIPYGTTVDKILIAANGTVKCRLSNKVYIESGEKVIFTTPRNRFYSQNHYSMVKTVFNQDQGNVKRFKTLNYEGSQGKVIPKDGITSSSNFYRIDNIQLPGGQIYSDNYKKDGWYVEKIKTDLQKGSVKEFISKENKWFDYIRGEEGDLTGDHLDTADFSLQGIGMFGGGRANNSTNQQ